MNLPAFRPPRGHRWSELLGESSEAWVVRCRLGEREAVCRVDKPGSRGESRAELAVLAAVRHPGLASFLDHGRTPDGHPFVTREFVPGEPLQDWAAGRSPEEVGGVVVSLAVALAALHDAGFVHADLKPGNVIVRDGVPVLCDFGLSSADRAPAEEVSGTFFALAPERLFGGAAAPAGDLFALGVLLHQLWVGHRTSARDFYGRFPGVDFFQATETIPAELPEWARDVVVDLLARDPAQRPPSARTVAGTLAARLGIEHSGAEGELLRWPVGRGREAWTEQHLARRDSCWVVVPEGEEPGPFARHLHVQAGLGGQSWKLVELDRAVRRHESPAEFEAWIVEAKREPALLVVADDPGDVAARLALRGLRAHPGRVCVVASEAPPEESDAAPWHVAPLDGVSLAQVEQYLEERLDEPEDRQRAAALALHRAGQGSATRLDRALESACRDGWYIVSQGHARLRPGPLPERLRTGGGRETRERLRDLSSVARVVLCAARFARTATDLAAAAGLDESSVAEAVAELLARRLLLPGPEGEGLDWAPDLEPAALREVLAADRWAEVHARWSRTLEQRNAPAHRVLPHRWCAEPGPSNRAALREECARLREAGSAEWALQALDAAEDLAAPLERALPLELVVERALAWCALGELARCEEVLAVMASHEGDEAEGLRARVRGAVALRRQDYDGAEAHLRESIRLAPEHAAEAAVARATALFYAGRDEEFSELAAAGADDDRWSERQRDQVRSLHALVHLRRGEVERARSSLGELVESAQARGDASAEAALRIDLGTVHRRGGDLDRARAELEQAVELYRRAGLISGLAQATSTLAGILRERGELLAAEPLLLEAVEMRERLGDRPGARLSRGMLGLHWSERGHARAALTELTSAADAIGGAGRVQYTPILEARADEMRARLGAEASYRSTDHRDPRVPLARARAAWMRGDAREARRLAEVGLQVGTAAGRAAECAEARFLVQILDGGPGTELDPAAHPGLVDDHALLRALAGDDAGELERLARSFEAAGRDDRAARARLALAAGADQGARELHGDRARAAFERCARGLSDVERDSLAQHLLGIPDPRPADLAHLSRPTSLEEFEVDALKLLEINHRLVEQQDLKTLVGAIVESALDVTGAERGFLMLEEDGEIRFDTALDSLRGPIDAPELEFSRSIVREALDKMETLRVSNAVDDPLLGAAPSVVSLELRSVLCVPFRVSQRLRGALYVDHRLRSGAFTERSARLLGLLADQASLAIRQVLRVEEISELNRRLNRKVVERESDLITAQRALREVGSPVPVGGLVGTSAKMRAVHGLIERAARTNIPVLVTGQSGTGKELAARAIHDLGSQKDGPFVTENCAAIPESLIESELFGHVRGAFTGAGSERAGMFERAHGGTLFLDEIGEMPIELQAKLLRVLETSELRRVGDSVVRKVEFRLVAATNRDLETRVEEGLFRADLFYRLDGLRLAMPPLSERTQDIPSLVDHFLRLQHAEDGVRREISDAVLARLCRRTWPGNVRELANEIARLCVLQEGDLDDPDLVREPGAPGARGASPVADDGVVPLAEVERRAILSALKHTGGDKREAAKLLGISRAKVYQRLKDWEEQGEPA